MKKNEFDVLSMDHKIDQLYRNAVYLSKRKTSNIVVLLFQLEDFYVEIVYTSYRRSIVEIKSFDNTDFLEPYLMSIDVAELLGENFFYKRN